MVEISLARTLALRSESELVDLHDRWIGGVPPLRRPELVQVLRDRMSEPLVVSNLCSGLYGAFVCCLRTLASAWK